jgi:hypothetical protein
MARRDGAAEADGANGAAEEGGDGSAMRLCTPDGPCAGMTLVKKRAAGAVHTAVRA